MTKVQLIDLINTQRELMVKVATGSPIVEWNDEYIKCREQLSWELAWFGLEDPNQFSDLWGWRDYWKRNNLQTYQSRREYVRDLYDPLVEWVSALALLTERAPTGWNRVDRALKRMRQNAAIAVAEEDCQAVGLLGREIFISLGQAVYDPARHPSMDNVEIGKADAKRMIESFIAAELGGETNERVRRYATAALQLALELQHQRTATKRSAELCTEATGSVVAMVHIIVKSRSQI